MGAIHNGHLKLIETQKNSVDRLFVAFLLIQPNLIIKKTIKLSKKTR